MSRICAPKTVFAIVLCGLFASKAVIGGSMSVRVNKCCEEREILVDGSCTNANLTSSGRWSPLFTDYNGDRNVQVDDFWFAIGIPKCGNRQMFTIQHDLTSRDRLALLPDGKLRHYLLDADAGEAFDLEEAERTNSMWDYPQGKYCMDKSISTKGAPSSEFAMVCSPEKDFHWTDPDFLLRKIVAPICHGISIIILLFVAICYFILPTLRDLVGSIVTTITCCLIVNQTAHLIKVFTELRHHTNFLVMDMIAQTSMMAAFFWLSSFGYFIWKTFRSRNVFLRITDGTKYCWYSFFAWGSTACMASLAIFAHLFLDIQTARRTEALNADVEVESLGVLGLTIYFVTIVGAISGCVYFYVSTQTYLNQRLNASYGRIHYKLKSNFVMFALLLCLLSITWVFTIFTWFEYEGMYYMNFATSILQAPLVLYICILRQEHVTYLLQKSCCSKQPLTAADWGDEMTYINTANR